MAYPTPPARDVAGGYYRLVTFLKTIATCYCNLRKGKNTFGYKNGSAYRFVIDNQQRLTIIAERDDNQESIYLSPGSHTLRLFIDNPDGSPMVTNFQTQIVIYESGKNIFRCNRSGMLTDLAVVPEK